MQSLPAYLEGFDFAAPGDANSSADLRLAGINVSNSFEMAQNRARFERRKSTATLRFALQVLKCGDGRRRRIQAFPNRSKQNQHTETNRTWAAQP